MATDVKEIAITKFERRTPFYDLWEEREGIPVYKVFHVDDLATVELAPWQRFGGSGALVNLADCHITSAMILEIPPGMALKPVQHLFETWVFVVQGEGETVLEQPGCPARTVRWKKRSLFGPPINIRYRHRNLGAAPARLLMVTNAPLTFNLYHNEKFIFDNPFVFDDRYRGEENFFDSTPRYLGGRVSRINYIPDTLEFQLIQWKERGLGAKSFHLAMSDHTMAAHLSEFEVGTYKKAHRHGPGAHVIVLSGTGYSLLWREGKDRVRVDWKAGSMFAPPDSWFHQHFNSGSEPARYLALRRGGSPEHPLSIGMKARDEGGPANQVEYENEEPVIYAMFEAELRKNGVSIRQPKMAKA